MPQYEDYMDGSISFAYEHFPYTTPQFFLPLAIASVALLFESRWILGLLLIPTGYVLLIAALSTGDFVGKSTLLYGAHLADYSIWAFSALTFLEILFAGKSPTKPVSAA